MRVLIAPDESASGLYRLREPARVLAAAGHDIAVMDPDNSFGKILDLRDGKPPVFLEGVPDADVVVFQRVMRDWRVTYIRALQQAGVAVVIEIDDDMHAVVPEHPSYRPCHPHWHQAQHSKWPLWQYSKKQLAKEGRHWLTAACDLADLVTCTTPALAERYAPHGRVKVLPNLVPAWYLQLKRYFIVDELPVIGWSGATATHLGDLEVTGGAVAQVVRDTGVPVHVVGTGYGVRAALGLDQEPTALGKWVPLEEYPQELARLDIGIVPLAPTPFNAAKSALKASEMASLGVVPVMSPTPDNLRLHRAGVGLVAKHLPEWRRHLTRLVQDPDRRHELAQRGREVMAARTYELHADRWLTAWQQAADRRARQRRRPGRAA